MIFYEPCKPSRNSTIVSPGVVVANLVEKIGSQIFLGVRLKEDDRALLAGRELFIFWLEQSRGLLKRRFNI